jgi:hypothetical protein
MLATQANEARRFAASQPLANTGFGYAAIDQLPTIYFLTIRSHRTMGASTSIPHNLHIGNRIPFSEQETHKFANQCRTMRESDITTSRVTTSTGSRGHLGCGALGGFYSSNSVSSLLHGDPN